MHKLLQCVWDSTYIYIYVCIHLVYMCVYTKCIHTTTIYMYTYTNKPTIIHTYIYIYIYIRVVVVVVAVVVVEDIVLLLTHNLSHTEEEKTSKCENLALEIKNILKFNTVFISPQSSQ